MNERRDMLELTVELTDEEVLARARTGATATEELLRLERAKADWMTAHKEQVAGQRGVVARMSECVRTAKEKRIVACITEFHKPAVGMKRTTRLDTGDVVKEESMSSLELQENLFPEKPENPAGLALVVTDKDVPAGEAYARDGQEE